MKNNRHTTLFVVCFICVLGLSNSEKRDDRGVPLKVREAIDEKLRLHYNKSLENCLNKVRRNAAKDVDSVLISFDRLVDIDTFMLGVKPRKPLKPVFKTELDTAPVREPDSIEIIEK
jgi:hypothetical protein